jgi:hypothetical protein
LAVSRQGPESIRGRPATSRPRVDPLLDRMELKVLTDQRINQIPELI